MEKPSVGYFAMCLVLLFIGITFTTIVFDLTDFSFMIELAVLFVLFAMFVSGMYAAYQAKDWGWNLIGAALILLLFDVFAILIFTRQFGSREMIVLFFTLVGLVITLLNLKIDFHSGVDEEEEAMKEKEYYPISSKNGEAEDLSDLTKVDEVEEHKTETEDKKVETKVEKHPNKEVVKKQ